MGELIFLDLRRRMRDRIQAAKRLAEDRQRRIDHILRYAKEHCNWSNEDENEEN